MTPPNGTGMEGHAVIDAEVRDLLKRVRQLEADVQRLREDLFRLQQNRSAER